MTAWDVEIASLTARNDTALFYGESDGNTLAHLVSEGNLTLSGIFHPRNWEKNPKKIH